MYYCSNVIVIIIKFIILKVISYYFIFAKKNNTIAMIIIRASLTIICFGLGAYSCRYTVLASKYATTHTPFKNRYYIKCKPTSTQYNLLNTLK